MSHQVFHNGQKPEMWIQHDGHHVLDTLCIKRLKKLQKGYDHLHNLQPHIFMEKKNLTFKLFKDFKPTKNLQKINFHVHNKCNTLVEISQNVTTPFTTTCDL